MSVKVSGKLHIDVDTVIGTPPHDHSGLARHSHTKLSQKAACTQNFSGRAHSKSSTTSVGDHDCVNIKVQVTLTVL